MEHIFPWIASSRPASQDIRCVLWKSQFIYLLRDILTLIRFLGNKKKESADVFNKIIYLSESFHST
jgi:hypothetical protein